MDRYVQLITLTSMNKMLNAYNGTDTDTNPILSESLVITFLRKSLQA